MALNQDQEMQEWKEWKDEPVSPSGTPLLELDDDWLSFNDMPLEFPNDAADDLMYDDRSNRAQVASRVLKEMEMQEYIKEESFSNWMEQRVYIPIFEELPIAPDDENVNDISYQTNPLKPQQQNTQTLLEEFETVLGDVEACHQIVPPNSSTLTPPQSPPSQQNVDTQLLITLQPVQQSPPLFPDNQQTVAPATVYNTIAPIEQQALFANSAARQWDAVEDIALNSLNLDRDAANELMAVEEYVRSHANDIPSPSSPCTSSGSSCISTEDLIDDPDWNVESERSKTKPSTSKGLSKPYRQSPRPSIEDRKVRKKEQNKNAATRYRQKKKQEIKDILGQEFQLTETNKKLKKEVVELKRELKVVKNMMREMFKARGVLQ